MAGVWRSGNMSRAQSREMYAKILASREANARAKREADLDRSNDPLEIAKTFLRRRGFHVFNENVLHGHARSARVIVGKTAMSADDVIAMANRHGAGFS